MYVQLLNSRNLLPILNGNESMSGECVDLRVMLSFMYLSVLETPVYPRL